MKKANGNHEAKEIGIGASSWVGQFYWNWFSYPVGRRTRERCSGEKKTAETETETSLWGPSWKVTGSGGCNLDQRSRSNCGWKRILVLKESRRGKF